MRTKKCFKCGLIKKIRSFAKNKTRKFGLQSTCKECFKKYYNNDTPENSRRKHIKKYYNLDWDIYKNWFELQEGKCAICYKDIKLIGDKDRKSGAHVDHDHDSGEFRVLLCHDCNAGLGYFHENSIILKEAIRYLRYFKHQAKKK